MRVLALVPLLWLCACGSVGRIGDPPAASSSPAALTQAELQYRVIEKVGAPVACDRTQGPILRTDDPADVARMVAALRAQNPDEFDAIVRHEHLNANSLSAADNLRVLGQSSVLAAVPLTPKGAVYGFAYQVAGPPSSEVAGTVDAAGAVTVASRSPAPRRPCPL